MTGQEKCELLIQVNVNRGDRMGSFDCIYHFKGYHIDGLQTCQL